MNAIRDDRELFIRPMLDSDVASVIGIEQQVYSHGWTAAIFHDCLRVHYSCWVVLVEEQLIGYGIMSAAAGEAHILNIAISEECQGQGHGRELMQFLVETARHHGADTVFLEVRPSNATAMRLYDSMGFHQVGLRHNYYPSDFGREDAVIMARPLDDIEV